MQRHSSYLAASGKRASAVRCQGEESLVLEVRKTSEELVDLRFAFVKGKVTVDVRVFGRTSEGLVDMMCDWEWEGCPLSQHKIMTKSIRKQENNTHRSGFVLVKR